MATPARDPAAVAFAIKLEAVKEPTSAATERQAKDVVQGESEMHNVMTFAWGDGCRALSVRGTITRGDSFRFLFAHFDEEDRPTIQRRYLDKEGTTVTIAQKTYKVEIANSILDPHGDHTTRDFMGYTLEVYPGRGRRGGMFVMKQRPEVRPAVEISTDEARSAIESASEAVDLPPFFDAVAQKAYLKKEYGVVVHNTFLEVPQEEMELRRTKSAPPSFQVDESGKTTPARKKMEGTQQDEKKDNIDQAADPGLAASEATALLLESQAAASGSVVTLEAGNSFDFAEGKEPTLGGSFGRTAQP